MAMTDIPPDIAVSAAQSGFQARESTRARAAQRAGEAHAAASQARTNSEVSDIVETDDQDVSVFADAEGTGSQGRRRADETPVESGESDSAHGVTRDEDGQWHVDLDA